MSDTVSKKYLDGEVDDKEKLVKWVQKEAYSKFVGLGIPIIRDISLSNIFDKSIIVRNEDYVCCVCSDCREFKEIKLV